MTQSTKTELIKILHDVEVTTGAKYTKLIGEVERIKVEPEYKQEAADMKIFDAVEQVTGINAIRLISKNRIRKYSDARAMVTFLLRDYGFTFVEIGMILNRHYTSAIHLNTVHQAMVYQDYNYRETFQKISGLIKSN
jgi:hypothetical protein